MTCNLVKEVVIVKNNKTGKDKKYNNYFLIFQNGYKLPITIRIYDTEKVSEEKEEVLKKVNFSNSQLINAFADELKDEE